MRVKPVLAKHVCNVSGGRAAQQHITNRKEHRIVKDGGESGIDTVPLFFAACEKRSYRGVRMKHFANGGKIRIDAAKPGFPLGPKNAPDIRKGGHAQSIQSR